MDQWSPAFEQPITQVSSGSPQLPQPEDSLNFGAGDSNSLLMTLANVDPSSNPVLPSDYENLMSQPLHSKEEFYDENLYNGICKEDLMGNHNFLQVQGPSTRAEAFTAEGNMPGYSNQTVPNQLLKRGSFGVLPHEAVTNHTNSTYERNSSDKYSTQPPSVSFNSGPYSDRDGSNIYSSAPLSAQSAFSGDTASHSPVVTSETSPSLSATFSSPDNYFNSPKTNFGAYNNSVQSPMPLSPSVAPTATSYPSSPFTNVDPSGHISSTTPCSPMGGGNFMNSLNAVPQRNGQKNQPSPSNSSANLCYPNQNMAYGPQPGMQKTPPDYHADFGYGHDHNPASSYSSTYPPMHPGHMSGGGNSRISPRTHSSHPSVMSHDGRMPYGNSGGMQSAPMSSPNYLPNQISHDHSYRPCSSNLNPGQSMQPPRFPPALNNLQNSNMHMNPPSSMADHTGNARHYNFLADPDGSKPYDPYSMVEPRSQHDPANSFTQFLETNLPMLDGEKLPTGRQLRPSEPSDHRQNSMVSMDNPGRVMCPPVSKDLQNDGRPFGSLNYPYSSSQLDPVRPGNFSMTSTGRRRGRRGRRRKIDMNSGNIPKYQSYKDERNMYSNGYLQPSKMLDYGSVDCYSAFKKRLCDEKELPPVNYPLSRYRLELKMTENQKKNCAVVLSKPPKQCVSIEEELSFLASLKFPEEDSPHSFMKTRNKDSEGFLQCYKNFLASRKRKSLSRFSEYSSQLKNASKDSSSHANREKHIKPIPKLIIKMDTSNSLRTYRLESSAPSDDLSGDESASDFSGDIPLSSHIKRENDSEEKSKRLKHSGKLYKSKHSAKHKRTHYDKCYDVREYETNSEHLLTGKAKVKPEIVSSPEAHEDLSLSPKKRGHKNKLLGKSGHKKRARKPSVKSSDAPACANFPALKIKQERLDEDEIPKESSQRILRSRRSDTPSSAEALPGPSIKIEVDDNHKATIDISSDEVEPLDDSDDDMDWTPNKSQKGGDHNKSHLQMSPKKRGPKPGRRGGASGLGGAPRPKKEKKEKPEKSSEPSIKKERVKKEVKVRRRRAASSIDPNIAVKKGKEQFLISKEDVNKESPFLWKIDKETNMLQRFESYEQQGITLYRSTYTYAALNQSSFANYVKALVRVVSHSRMLHVVEYLGPDLTSPSENPFLPETKAAGGSVPDSTATPTITTATNPLRENFEVFLQTLISQALDPNFLTEITNENDEYFLSNIKEIETITETKKKTLSKDFWEENLLKSINSYPSVDVIDIPDSGDCEVCKKKTGSKLLQFHGQPYDFITLGSVEQVLPSQAQYNVCDVCSATLSLYCRLQHQKYNFFIKCRGKMNDVIGASGDNVESHVLLEECLQDHAWVNSLFEELETMWQQVDAKS